MKTEFVVILENWDGMCKRVRLMAVDSNAAIALATFNYPGWTAVGVEK